MEAMDLKSPACFENMVSQEIDAATAPCRQNCVTVAFSSSGGDEILSLSKEDDVARCFIDGFDNPTQLRNWLDLYNCTFTRIEII
jgi:hypothetical protein